MLDLNQTRGHEQAGIRPALIVSVDLFNDGPAGLVIVCPITSRSKAVRSHVAILAPEGGLTTASYVKCEDIRSVSSERLIRRLGRVESSTLASVEEILQILMGL